MSSHPVREEHLRVGIYANNIKTAYSSIMDYQSETFKNYIYLFTQWGGVWACPSVVGMDIQFSRVSFYNRTHIYTHINACVYLVCEYNCLCALGSLWRSEDNLPGLVLSFHHVDLQN